MRMERTTQYGTDTTVMAISHNSDDDGDDNDDQFNPQGVNAMTFWKNVLGVVWCFLFVAGGYTLMTLKHGSNFLISNSSSFVEDHDTTSSMIDPYSDLHVRTSTSDQSPDVVGSHRSILLLRHAKSSWENININAKSSSLSDEIDEQRPLLAQGIQDAKRLGKYLAHNQIPVPDVIYSSPSLRTRQTLYWVQEHWATHVPVQFMNELYNDELVSSSYITFCRSALDPIYHRVMIVGHNPAIQATAIQLIQDSDSSSSLSSRLLDGVFPTAGLVEIVFWNKENDDDDNKGWEYVVDQSDGIVTRFVTPTMTT